MWHKISTRAKQQLAVLLVCCVVSIGMTWPILYGGRSTPLSLLAMGATMLSLVLLAKVGSSAKGWLWKTSALALALGIIAPLISALALAKDSESFPTWWIGLSALFGVATVAAAIARHRELTKVARERGGA